MLRSGVRRLGLLLGRLLTVVCLTLGVLGLGSVGAHAATSLQLENEVFRSAGVAGSSLTGQCLNGDGAFTFSVSGTASGPYPGTFQEFGAFTITNTAVSAFTATFTITTSGGTVTGTKSLSHGGVAICQQDGSATYIPGPSDFSASYTATRHGSDQVTGDSDVSITGSVGAPPDFEEQFGPSCQGLCQNPGLPPPTNKAQCKHGGWKSFGTMFKNQGDCVSFVATGGKNPASGG